MGFDVYVWFAFAILNLGCMSAKGKKKWKKCIYVVQTDEVPDNNNLCVYPIPVFFSEFKIVCKFESTATIRRGQGKFFIDNIDTRLCTHVIYKDAKMDIDGRIRPQDPFLDLSRPGSDDLKGYNRTVELKKQNPDLIVMIMVGGWNEGSTKYSNVTYMFLVDVLPKNMEKWIIPEFNSQMAARSDARETFVKSAVSFCLTHKFDGLDLDWEYPANRGGVPEDKANYIELLKELREE